MVLESIHRYVYEKNEFSVMNERGGMQFLYFRKQKISSFPLLDAEFSSPLGLLFPIA